VFRKVLFTAVIAVLAGGTPSFADDALAAAPHGSATSPPDVLPPGMASPVQIDNCRLEYNSGGGFGLIGMLVKTTGQLKIKFTNEGDKQISTVRFRVNLDSQTLSVRDVGKFSPNVTVDHGFKDYSGTMSFVFSRQPQPKCHVTFVKYADGSVWGLPDDPDPNQPSGTAVLVTPSPAVTVTPAAVLLRAPAPEVTSTP
jgi:hypothetical protein